MEDHNLTKKAKSPANAISRKSYADSIFWLLQNALLASCALQNDSK